MPGMRRADRGDAAGMRTMGQPVEKFRPYRPAPLAATRPPFGWPRAAGNQQDHPRTLRQRQRQRMIEPGMGGIERVAVKVNGEIGGSEALRQLAVPRSVKCVIEGTGLGRCCDWRRRSAGEAHGLTWANGPHCRFS